MGSRRNDTYREFSHPRWLSSRHSTELAPFLFSFSSRHLSSTFNSPRRVSSSSFPSSRLPPHRPSRFHLFRTTVSPFSPFPSFLPHLLSKLPKADFDASPPFLSSFLPFGPRTQTPPFHRRSNTHSISHSPSAISFVAIAGGRKVVRRNGGTETRLGLALVPFLSLFDSFRCHDPFSCPLFSPHLSLSLSLSHTLNVSTSRKCKLLSLSLSLNSDSNEKQRVERKFNNLMDPISSTEKNPQTNQQQSQLSNPKQRNRGKAETLNSP